MNGADVRNIRTKLRLKQRQLAALLDMRHETLSKIECGRSSALPPRMALVLTLISMNEETLQKAMSFMEVGDD
jgi:transcriptional regulator with XRE-family HTH domain